MTLFREEHLPRGTETLVNHCIIKLQVELIFPLFKGILLITY